jgi:hypothetical protein
VHLPDLSAFELDRIVDDCSVWDVAVPGLRATYYRSVQPDRTLTAGVYAYQGVEVFVAWGYAGERHCRFHAFRDLDGKWERPRPGCPRVRPVQAGDRVTGLLVRTGSGERTVPAQLVASGAATGSGA